MLSPVSEPIFGKGMRRSTFQWKKGVFSERGEEIQWTGGWPGWGKDFYRKGNSVKRSGRCSEPPALKSEKLLSSSPSRKLALTVQLRKSFSPALHAISNTLSTHFFTTRICRHGQAENPYSRSCGFSRVPEDIRNSKRSRYSVVSRVFTHRNHTKNLSCFALSLVADVWESSPPKTLDEVKYTACPPHTMDHENVHKFQRRWNDDKKNFWEVESKGGSAGGSKRGSTWDPLIVALKHRKNSILERCIFNVVAFSRTYSDNSFAQLPRSHPPVGRIRGP